MRHRPMAEERARASFFLKDNKDKRRLWNLHRLTRKLNSCLQQLQQRPVTQHTLRYIEELALLIACVAQDIRNCLPPDPA